MTTAAIKGGRVTAATDTQGTLAAPGAANEGGALSGLPRFCRLSVVLTPVAGSRIGVELWLPERWNGKLLGLGNHGFGGEYERGYMAMGLARGYAVVTTDTGHSSRDAAVQAGFSSGRAVSGGFNIGSAAFATGNPVAVEDFAWRAIHEMTVAAKALALRYYGAAPRRAYFDGCSTGGRQAMREVQAFPADYDGVVAGGAPMDWSRVMAAGLHYYLAGYLRGGGRIAPAKLDLAHRAAVAACDAADGLADGLIADPARCGWKPAALLCKPGDDPARCLSADEVAAVASAERAPLDRDGRPLYAPLAPGGESFWLLMTTFNPVTSNYYRYMVLGDPAWTPDRNTDLPALLARSETPGAPGLAINDTSPDLAAFRARGGKLIQYHGWNDQAMAPGFYPAFYDQVVSRQAGADQLARTQDFYRLFMAPGMTHCSGGEGPVNFGGLNHLPSPTVDADHDLLEALDRWVEQGAAPERIVATQFADTGAVQRQMPLCPWPAVALYKAGDPRRAESFECRAPVEGALRHQR